MGVALGLANLLHVRHWSWLLNPNNDYFRAAAVPWEVGITTVAGVIATCAGFLVAKLCTERLLPRRLARELTTAAFLACGLLVLNGLRHQAHALTLPRSIVLPPWPVAGLAATAAFAALAAAMRWRFKLARALASVMLWSLPFVALTFGQVMWMTPRLFGDDERFVDQPAGPRLPHVAGGPRVLILVFDGLDQTEAFDDPSAPMMAEFERLRRESVDCTSAYPPSGSTAISLPSLLLGRGVEDVARAGPNDLSLRLEGAARRGLWSAEAGLFRTARQEGVNVGVVGWYHPYCRMFGSELAECHAHPYLAEPDYSCVGNWRRYLAGWVELCPGALRYGLTASLGLMEPTPLEQRLWHVTQCQAIEAEAQELALDRTLGLVFVHYPVPHFPYIYDSSGEHYDASGGRSYPDNLALADRVLGRLRLAMEREGLWESTTVVVTADHWNRDQRIPHAGSRFPLIGYRAHRVPLLIKTRGQSTHVAVDQVIRTYHLHDLALAVLRGDLQDAQAVAAWLARRTQAAARTGRRASSGWRPIA